MKKGILGLVGLAIIALSSGQVWGASEDEFTEALKLARRARAAESELGWGAVRKLILREEGKLSAKSIAELEKVWLSGETLGWLKTVELLYSSDPVLAWERLALRGMPKYLSKERTQTLFLVAAIAIIRGKLTRPEEVSSSKLDLEVSAEKLRLFQSVHDSLTVSAGPDEPNATLGEDTTSDTCLQFLASLHRVLVKEPERNRVLNDLLRCAAKKAETPLAERIRSASAERAIPFLEDQKLSLDMKTILEGVEANTLDGSVSIDKSTLYPDFSSVTTPALTRDVVYAKLTKETPSAVVIPLPEARLRYDGHDVGPVALSSYPKKGNYPRGPEVKLEVATPESLVAQGEGQFNLEFGGSDRAKGCVFHSSVANEAMSDTHELSALQLGFASDAYVKKGGEATKLQFWTAGSLQPSDEGNWVAVRWRTDSKAPIAESFEKTVLAHTSHMRDEEGKAFIKGSLEYAQKQLGAEGLNREVAKYVERYRRGERVDSALLKDQASMFPEISFGLFKVLESTFQDFSYTSATKGEILCVLGCLTRRGIESENSDWVLFTRVPNYKGPMVFESVASPLVTHRIPFEALHGRGGLAKHVLEVLDISNAAASRFMGDSPFQISRISEKEEKHPLLAYAATLQKYLSSSPQGDGERPEIEALKGLSEVVSLQQLALLPEESKVVAQRQLFLRSAIPRIASAIFSRHVKPLETQVHLLAFTSLSTSRIRKELLNATSNYETLSQDERVALLSQVTKLAAAEREGVSQTIQAFETALLGAQQKMAEFDLELKTRLRVTCEAVKKFQFKGRGLVPSMQFKKEVVDLCYGL